MIAQTWIGTLPGWLTLAALLAGTFVIWRGGSSTAIEGLQATNRELERQIHERNEQVKGLEARVKVLEARTDVAAVVAPVVEAMALHENRAERRSVAMIAILEQVAARLGPDAD